ncbi:MAG: aminotransferase class IV [Halobacteriota archaeon]|uniref:aminotransferase class IV n=1 Tax=Natronomonas sp. TaxID=2184060 RepID=UPI003975AC28
MSLIYHLDGELVERAEATVHVDDRGFRYGDAAFETCRAYGGTVFEWDRHLDRLGATCETLGMAEAVPDDLKARVDETLAANDLGDAYVRVSISRGVQPGKLTPSVEVDPTVVVYVKSLSRGGVDGDPVWDGSATVETVDTRRIPDAAVPVDAKTHNYLNGILARLELRGSTAEEVVMRDTDGFLAEGATSNLFFVDDGTLKTPAPGTILPGITRRLVVELADSVGVAVETGRYRQADLREADEAFLTNTTWELRPIGRADGAVVGGGAITNRLRTAYDELVEARCYR